MCLSDCVHIQKHLCVWKQRHFDKFVDKFPSKCRRNNNGIAGKHTLVFLLTSVSLDNCMYVQKLWIVQGDTVQTIYCRNTIWTMIHANIEFLFLLVNAELIMHLVFWYVERTSACFSQIFSGMSSFTLRMYGVCSAVFTRGAGCLGSAVRVGLSYGVWLLFDVRIRWKHRLALGKVRSVHSQFLNEVQYVATWWLRTLDRCWLIIFSSEVFMHTKFNI